MKLQTKLTLIALAALVGALSAAFANATGLSAWNYAHSTWIPVWGYVMFGAIGGAIFGLRVTPISQWGKQRGILTAAIGAVVLAALAWLSAAHDLRGAFAHAPVGVAALCGGILMGALMTLAILCAPFYRNT